MPRQFGKIRVSVTLSDKCCSEILVLIFLLTRTTRARFQVGILHLIGVALRTLERGDRAELSELQRDLRRFFSFEELSES